MRWEDYRQSTNVEDGRRGGIGIGRATGGVGIGGLILAGILYFAFGIDPRIILEGGVPGFPPQVQERRAEPADPNDRMARFVSSVLATTEDSWNQIFQEAGRTYEAPRLRLFNGQVQSACGFAEAASGPFYCPLDRRVYLDMTFFRELEQRFRAPGDFAAAYVIGHEVGHHVQNLMGVLPRVQEMQRGAPRAEANALQVRVELQADCLAGVWANRTQRIGLLEAGDIEEALAAAAAIGDDTLQRRSGGRVVPETFTHGTSQQRMQWFLTGARSGRLQACNTFGNARL